MKHTSLHVWSWLVTSVLCLGLNGIVACTRPAQSRERRSAEGGVVAATGARGGANLVTKRRVPVATSPVDPRELFAAADRRTVSPALNAALLAGDASLRAQATLAVARLHDVTQAASLRSALSDPAPSVRQAASLGLGALEEESPAGTDAALLGALATERQGDTRAALLADLGRISRETAFPAFRAALEASLATEREAACRGLGAVGLRGRSVEAPLLQLIAARAARDPAPGVRLACSYALSRLPAPVSTSADVTAAVVADLVTAARDVEPEVRLMVARALAKYPATPASVLGALCADEDWRVASQAFRTLARRSSVGSDGPYAAALRAQLDRQLRVPLPVSQPEQRRAIDASVALDSPAGASPPRLSMPEAHVLLVALDEAASVAAGVNVASVAQEALARLTVPNARATRAEGLAHCLAAKLVDLGRGWPQRLTHCGLGQVSETERSVRMAEVLAAATGDPAGRVGYLMRLYDRGDARVREAVLAATAGVDDPSAGRLILRALREHDLGVVTSALEAVAAQPARLLAIVDAAAQVPPDVAHAMAAQPSLAPVAPSPQVSTDVRGALVSARETLVTTDELEGLQAWLDAVAALRDPALAPGVRLLAGHSNVALRLKAQETLKRLNLPPFDGPIARIDNALDASRLPRSGERLSALLVLASGEVELELLSAEAPTTVARFVALAQRGFYDGLRFHRVVPGFVVQTGDPRGDGYGGPGYAQRCEDNRVRYERGIVGMALAGRDTGGSQFFISQGAQPHLDGRYTAFGRVVRGMALVDQILPGDIVLRVRIHRTGSISNDTSP